MAAKRLSKADIQARLQRRAVEADRELFRRLKTAQREAAAKIERLAAQPAAAVSLKARNQLHAEISSVYEAQAAGIEEWLLELAGKTGEESHARAVADMRTAGGKPLVKFSRERVLRHWEMLHPANKPFLVAVFTEQMAASDIRNLRSSWLDVFRQQAVSGWTARETQKQLQSRWDQIAGNLSGDRFVDAAGRRWTNAQYLQMLTRTTFQRIDRESYVDALVAEGNTLARITDDGDPCPICRAWAGLIVDISGNQKTHYPSLKQAYAAGWSHPNCSCRTEYLDPAVDKAEIARQRKQPAADWKDPKAVQGYNDDIRIREKRDGGMTMKEAERDLKRDKLRFQMRSAFPTQPDKQEWVNQIPADTLDKLDRNKLPRIEPAKKGDAPNSSRDSSLGGVLKLARDSKPEDYLKAFQGLEEKRGIIEKPEVLKPAPSAAPSIPPPVSPQPAAPSTERSRNLSVKTRALAVEIKNEPREVFVLVDGEGKELYPRHTSGVSGGNVPAHWKLEGANIIHNHPSALRGGNNGFGASFSDSDVMTAVSKRMGSVTAVAGKRTYIMEPPADGDWGTSARKVKNAYEKQLKLSVAEMIPRVKAGRVTKEQAILVAAHRAWKGVASEFGFRYTVLRGG